MRYPLIGYTYVRVSLDILRDLHEIRICASNPRGAMSLRYEAVSKNTSRMAPIKTE